MWRIRWLGDIMPLLSTASSRVEAAMVIGREVNARFWLERTKIW
jgi:hypothetical protein